MLAGVNRSKTVGVACLSFEENEAAENGSGFQVPRGASGDYRTKAIVCRQLRMFSVSPQSCTRRTHACRCTHDKKRENQTATWPVRRGDASKDKREGRALRSLMAAFRVSHRASPKIIDGLMQSGLVGWTRSSLGLDSSNSLEVGR